MPTADAFLDGGADAFLDAPAAGQSSADAFLDAEDKGLYLRTMDTLADASGKVTETIKTGAEGAVAMAGPALQKRAADFNKLGAAASSVAFPQYRPVIDAARGPLIDQPEADIKRGEEQLAKLKEGQPYWKQLAADVGAGFGALPAMALDVAAGRGVGTAAGLSEAMTAKQALPLGMAFFGAGEDGAQGAAKGYFSGLALHKAGEIGQTLPVFSRLGTQAGVQGVTGAALNSADAFLDGRVPTTEETLHAAATNAAIAVPFALAPGKMGVDRPKDSGVRIDTKPESAADSLHGVADRAELDRLNATAFPGSSEGNRLTPEQFGAFMETSPAGQALSRTIADLRASGRNDLADKLQITSANAGGHAQNSRHYKGQAVDINAKALTPDEQAAVADIARRHGLMRDVAGEPWHFSYRGQSAGGADYLSRVRQAESGGNDQARAETSSASGPFQFTDLTWRAMVNQYGRDYGLTLDGKSDPAQQQTAAALLTGDNREHLRTALGREPSDGDLYLAHVFGRSGAEQLLTGLAENPGDAAVNRVNASAARANHSIFYTKDGRARTNQEVYDLMAAKVAPKDGVIDTRSATPIPGVDDVSSQPQGQPQPAADAWPLRPELDALRQDMEERAPGVVEGQGNPWDQRPPAARIDEAFGLDTPLGRRAELESLRQDIQGRDVTAKAADEMGAPVPATEAARIGERPALPEGQGFDLVPDAMRRDRLPAKLEDAPTMPAQPGDVRWHLNEQPTDAYRGITPEQAAHAVRKYVETAPDSAPVRIVQSQGELPQHLLDEYRRSGSTGAIEGVYDRGSRAVWLVADNLESKSRAGEIWLHENVAHHGLRAVFGSDKGFDAFLKRNAPHFGYGSDHIAMEEHIARMAEKMDVGQALTPQERSLWGRFVDYVRGWLVKNGWATPKTADLRALLQESLVRMTREKAGQGGEATGRVAAFSSQRDPREFRAFLEGEPVSRLRGDEFPKFKKLSQLVDVVANWWAKKYHGQVNNPELGDVAIDRRAASYSAGHGMSPEKQAAFAAVPDIIQRGKVLSSGEKIPGSGLVGHVIGAPVEIGGKAYVALALVREDANKRRFYVHDVYLTEKLRHSQSGPLPKETPTESNAGAFKKTLSSIFAPDKTGGEESGRFSARPEEALERDADTAVKAMAEGMKRDIGPLARWFGTPDYTFQKHPVAWRIYNIFRDRTNRAHEILHAALDLPDGSTVMDKWKALPDQTKALVNRIIDVADVREIKRPAVEQWMAEKNIPEPAREMYRIMRDKYDALLEERLRPYKEMLEKGVNPDIQYRDADGKPVTMSLKEAVGEMGRMQGFYAPRIRQTGDLAVLARRKLPGGDFEYARHHVDWKLQAKELEKKLRAEGWEITGREPVQRLGESTQQAIARVGEVAKVVESAAQGMKGTSGEAQKAFLESLVEELSTEIKARGFRSSAIRRTGREGRVVRGYIEDAGERFAQYAQRTSYGIAKMESAQEAVRAMFTTGQDGRMLLDPRREPRTFEMVQNYMKDQLRNAEKADRVISLGKSIATFKFLGFNPKSALMNLTTLATQVPPALRVYAGDSKVSLLRTEYELTRSLPDAMAFMLGKSRKGLNPEERAFLGEIQRRDLDDPQFARESFKNYQATSGRLWSGAMNKAMLMFGATEQFNRLSTQIAGYRVARLAGFPHQEAMELALLASDRAHGVYGREAMPEAAWGTNAGARMMQLGYVYQKYAHNTLQLLADVWGKGDARAFMHLLAAPLVMGGVGTGVGALGWSAAKAIYSTLGDSRDPKEAFFSWVRRALGQDAEQYARFGAFGALGIDVSGSMDTQIRMPGTLKELAGPIGGVVNDLVGDRGAAHYLATGQPGKALEKALPTGIAKPFQAMRETTEGVTSSRGYPLRDDQGGNYMPTQEETAAKALGFRPAREARLKDMDFAAREEERAFQDRRQDIMEAYRAWSASGGTDRKRLDGIVSDIAKFNADVEDFGRADVQPITQRSLESSLMNFRNASKQELGRRGIGDAPEADPIGPENFALAEKMVRFREVKAKVQALYSQTEELIQTGRADEARALVKSAGLGTKAGLVKWADARMSKAREIRKAVEDNPRLTPQQRQAYLAQADALTKQALAEFEKRMGGSR